MHLFHLAVSNLISWNKFPDSRFCLNMVVITCKCHHTNHAKIKRECFIIFTECCFVLCAASAFWMMLSWGWQKKLCWELWQHSYTLVASSDRPNQQKSCPFHVIGQCNNLQPTVCRWDRYSLYSKSREEGAKFQSSLFSVGLVNRVKVRNLQRIGETSHSIQSSDHCTGSALAETRYQHWLILKVALSSLGCNHVAGKSEGHSYLTLCYMLLRIPKHRVIIIFQAFGQSFLRLFGLVFTDSLMFWTVNNSWGIKWLSEKAEGNFVIQKHQREWE